MRERLNYDGIFHCRLDEFSPVKERYFTGKVVCTNYSYVDGDLTIGKVYSIDNGVLLKNNGNFLTNKPIKNMQELKNWCNMRYYRINFIEYKGMA